MIFSKPYQYYRSYDNCFVYKIFLKAVGESKCRCTLEQAMEIIKQIANFSAGLPQIVYLVGWNHDGHDSKYPDWSIVGSQCAYLSHREPVNALRAFIRDARRYHAVVSLHINMDDAYEDSPLWEEYCAQNLINLNNDGKKQISGQWSSGCAYEISKTREWESGLTQKRILGLLKLIPELRQSATIHLDALRPRPSTGLGTDMQQEIDSCRKIFEFWHSNGIDVTCEFLASYDFIGYVPMVWALNLDEEGRLKYPSSVICGGSADWNQRRKTMCDPVSWIGLYGVPSAGCLYDAAWGASLGCDFQPTSGNMPADRMADFYLKTLPWHFLNRFRALELRQTTSVYKVIFSNGVESSIETETGCQRITWNDIPILDNGNLCIEAVWRQDSHRRFFLFFSRDGGEVTFHLPTVCSGSGQRFILSTSDPVPAETTVIRNGVFTLTLAPKEAGKIDLSNCTPDAE